MEAGSCGERGGGLRLVEARGRKSDAGQVFSHTIGTDDGHFDITNFTKLTSNKLIESRSICYIFVGSTTTDYKLDILYDLYNLAVFFDTAAIDVRQPQLRNSSYWSKFATTIFSV